MSKKEKKVTRWGRKGNRHVGFTKERKGNERKGKERKAKKKKKKKEAKKKENETKVIITVGFKKVFTRKQWLVAVAGARSLSKYSAALSKGGVYRGVRR